MAFIKSSPQLTMRLRPDEIEAWHEAGMDILKQTQEGGEAFFRLESGKAEETIHALSARVDLQRVSELLRLYGKALTGTNISVQPVSRPAREGHRLGERARAVHGGHQRLPAGLHRALRDEGRTTSACSRSTRRTRRRTSSSAASTSASAPTAVSCHASATRSKTRRAPRALVSKTAWVTDMERFFDLFQERQIAADLFTVTEDMRIDARVHEDYGGIRRAGAPRAGAGAGLPAGDARACRCAWRFVEALIRASLEGEQTITWPKPLRPILAEALSTLAKLRNIEAAVEDAAEATLILYDLAMKIPNLPPEMLEDLDWDEMTEEQLEDLMRQAGESSPEEGLEELPEGEEMPYESPESVELRGDFKPELVQLLMRMRMNQTDEMSARTSWRS